jgi:hypothetical protein
VPSGVCNRLAAVQFGGITEITQGKTRNVAVDKIQPVAVQHCAIIFFRFRITVSTYFTLL